jgi:hypothetical protein
MPLVLKRVMASRVDDYDVLADGIVVGRLTKAAAAPEGKPWMWTLAYRAAQGSHPDVRL